MGETSYIVLILTFIIQFTDSSLNKVRCLAISWFGTGSLSTMCDNQGHLLVIVTSSSPPHSLAFSFYSAFVLVGVDNASFFCAQLFLWKTFLKSGSKICETFKLNRPMSRQMTSTPPFIPQLVRESFVVKSCLSVILLILRRPRATEESMVVLCNYPE